MYASAKALEETVDVAGHYVSVWAYLKPVHINEILRTLLQDILLALLTCTSFLLNSSHHRAKVTEVGCEDISTTTSHL